MTTRILATTMLLVLSFVSNDARAQTVFSFYEVSDILSGSTKKEIWLTGQAKNSEFVFLSKKIHAITQENIETEVTDIVNGHWLKKTQSPGKDSYHEEMMATLPFELEPGERSFGYINVRNVETNIITEAWPLFVAIEQDGERRKATFTAFLPENKVIVTTRIYTDKSYMFPSSLEVKKYKSGVMPQNVPTIANPAWFLDSYTISKRVE